MQKDISTAVIFLIKKKNKHIEIIDIYISESRIHAFLNLTIDKIFIQRIFLF